MKADMKELQNFVLSQDARVFLDKLHKQFNTRRLELLAERKKVQEYLDDGWNPSFPEEMSDIRNDPEWKTTSIPADVTKRWVEITGPVERKMMINALNSGADIFMADFEDSLSPTWSNVLEGQVNLRDAVRKTLEFTSPEGKEYRLKDKLATLFVRPRGWHLDETHYKVDNVPISASLFDFGLYFFHNAKELSRRHTGPYFYLPKMENAKEAALWNEVFAFAEKELGFAEPVIKATVLIETILAAFQMEEILYALKNYCIGLNAGRWDYIFSIIKNFSAREDFNFPDRKQITMAVPFMQAYSRLIIQTCHKRGAFAMGGMSAFVPSRKDQAINEIAFAQVKEDKLREVKEGFDGTWVAHPDLVPLAREVFEMHLNGKNHQIDKQLDTVIKESDLLNFTVPDGKITLNGLTQNISAAMHYIQAWLKGIGAVTIHNLMEDAATAEISRAQIWQWIHHNAKLSDQNTPITLSLVNELLKQSYDKDPEQLKPAYAVLKKLIEHKTFINFLTLEAYPYLGR